MKFGIFIDRRNKEQVNWWNNCARKQIKIVSDDKIVESATGKIIAHVFCITGKLAKKIFEENDQFIENPVSVFKTKDGEYISKEGS